MKVTRISEHPDVIEHMVAYPVLNPAQIATLAELTAGEPVRRKVEILQVQERYQHTYVQIGTRQFIVHATGKAVELNVTKEKS